MKRIILILVFLLAVIIPGNILAASCAEVKIDPDSPFEEGAFYGIWMGASKDLEDAIVSASYYPAEIGVVQIFKTTDWENLNPEPWYVLTAGMYASRTEAESVLPKILGYYPEAYVKYSGKRLSHFANDTSKTSGWIGTWIADDGEKLVITDTSNLTLSMIYNGYYAKGGMFESPYILLFQNSDKTIAAEAQEVLDRSGWRRELELSGDSIVMRSRYPDKMFYRVTETTADSTETANDPFYGIWCYASKEMSEAQSISLTMKNNGLSAAIYYTTDWENLNPDPWYVVTAGTYKTREEAETYLPQAQAFCPDAYIKYSGNYKG